MAGDITDTGELYSPFVGLVYMFNLIVGTGALTMPKAFGMAGWLVSLFLLILLAFMSFVTTTFVVEAMAAANAHIRWKSSEEKKEHDDSDSEESERPGSPEVMSSTGSSGTSLNREDRFGGRAERRPLLSPETESPTLRRPDLFDITQRAEMGQMASIFFNKVGLHLFYLCIVIYLYGDLAIYAAAVPHSLAFVACGNLSRTNVSSKVLDSDPCWGTITRGNAYRIFLAAFLLLLGPFTFFNVQKTKYLQILTTLMRWIAFIMMIVLAILHISKGEAQGHPAIGTLSGVPNLFGVCIYSFMCQHSLPSLLTPVSDKRRLGCVTLSAYALVLAFYSLLAFTAVFAYPTGALQDLYTLNFLADPSAPIGVRYFLGLFPVFTISTNFPIIAVTLRNNLRSIFLRDGTTYPWLVECVVFPLAAVLPPVVIAFLTHDLEWLVGVTGAYAGTGIQYVTPAFLALSSRRHVAAILPGRGGQSTHLSPFRHRLWAYFILGWAASCIVFVTANIIINDGRR
ncbi:transmembrane protein 104 [Lampetra fluviatilis]